VNKNSDRNNLYPLLGGSWENRPHYLCKQSNNNTMPFFDAATLGIVISIMGWGINRIESLRGKIQQSENQISHNSGRIEILQADFSSKLDILIFRVRILEERIREDGQES
jgi:hypothetical protein